MADIEQTQTAETRTNNPTEDGFPTEAGTSASDTTGDLSPAKPRRTAHGRRRRAIRRLFLKLCGATLLGAIAAPVQAHFVEPFALDTTQYEVFLPNLPPQYDGFRIAHLTDLHRGETTPDDIIKQAIAVTVAAEPHLVVVTGDFVERWPDDAKVVNELLSVISAPYGIWGCLGNHDYARDAMAVAGHLQANNIVRLLTNTATELAPGLWLAGIDDAMRGRPDGDAALRSVPKDAALIFLTHNPTGVFSVTERDCLVLAGHTHGGQIVIPGFPPLRPGGMAGFPLVAGWGLFDHARLFISRGVGMSGLPFRFNCRPEVAFLTLRRGDALPKASPNLAYRVLRKAARTARRLWSKIKR